MTKYEFTMYMAKKYRIPREQSVMELNRVIDSLFEVAVTGNQVKLHEFGKFYPFNSYGRVVLKFKCGRMIAGKLTAASNNLAKVLGGDLNIEGVDADELEE